MVHRAGIDGKAGGHIVGRAEAAAPGLPWLASAAVDPFTDVFTQKALHEAAQQWRAADQHVLRPPERRPRPRRRKGTVRFFCDCSRSPVVAYRYDC